MPPQDSHPLQSRFRRYQQQQHGRHQDKVSCVLCRTQIDTGLERYTEHFKSVHAGVIESEQQSGQDPLDTARKYYRRSQNPLDAGHSSKPDETSSPARSSKATTALAQPGADIPSTPASPPASGVSVKATARGTSPSSQGKTQRSHARRAASASDASDFARPPNNTNASLWTGTTNTKRGNRGSAPAGGAPRLLQHPQSQQQPGPKRHDDAERDVTTMLRQPDTRPISQQQLVTEVKGIYKGLVLVESKCIEVDAAQSAQEGDGAVELKNEQWQALGALHRALLHEHHDFFLASQHHSASPPLKRLASKYSMPARMWRHGIHSYLELLRHRLPESREHMLSYIYLSYDMMALLYETVPSYKETWIECLGDLGRYRMAIEDDNIQDRETWTEVSRQWYKKASDLSPGTGRLYHHLAILARPNWLQQLLYYSKSLCVPNPFESARESILTLFDPLIKEAGPHPYEMQQQPIDPPFVRCHACMFMRTGPQRSYADKFLALLDNHIARTARLFLQPAYTIGIANCCALVEYGSKSNVILQVIDKADEPLDQDEEDGTEEVVPAGYARSSAEGSISREPTEQFIQARALTCETARLILNRLGDPNVWPFVHVTMVFVYHLTFFDSKGGMAHIEQAFPWTSFVNLLNTLRVPTGPDSGSGSGHLKFESDTFPGLAEGGGSPLPEDFMMRGLIWTTRYHPEKWIEDAKVDDEDKSFELASMAEQRKDRILWLGYQIAKCERWILYDKKTHTFSVAGEFAEVEVEAEPGGDEDVKGEVMDVDSEGSEQTVGA
ncbi:uncharacterized protein DNG_02697 [Cephalotrichum gorgonifer]|uniref:DNA/RNA-binding domain-containing protein n=1 Tax=Cephalotrichum gorgonifer TaxID=2041049 RepID=A0AAE8MVI6_9PEZI|nr:uncharacterized protein DNG_02697 [Cephalotrichum gorgonifer]